MTRLVVTWQNVLSREPVTGPARTGARAESRSVATTTEPATATASMTASGSQATAPAPAILVAVIAAPPGCGARSMTNMAPHDSTCAT